MRMHIHIYKSIMQHADGIGLGNIVGSLDKIDAMHSFSSQYPEAKSIRTTMSLAKL